MASGWTSQITPAFGKRAMDQNVVANRPDLFGLELVRKLTVDELDGIIQRHVVQRRTVTISYIGFHTVNLIASNLSLRKTFKALDIVWADGIAMEWALRMMGRPLTIHNRIGGDIIAPFVYAESVKRGWGIYLLGGAPGTAVKAAQRLAGAYPGLRIAGTHHGYFSSEAESEAVIDEINRSKAAIVLVGMGQPRQEEWIVASKDRLHAAVLLAVGGYFEHLLKQVDCYPAWVYRWRLNWAHRLVREPRRLWKRYTVGVLLFGLRVLWARVRGGRLARESFT